MDAVHYAEEAHAHGEADIRTVLACHEDLHKQRRDFLNAVYNYNLDVAEYAAIVAAPGTPEDKFVAMLIRPKPADRLSAIPEKPSADPFSSGVLESELRAREFIIRASRKRLFPPITPATTVGSPPRRCAQSKPPSRSHNSNP